MKTTNTRKYDLTENDIKRAISEYISKQENFDVLSASVMLNHQVSTSGMGPQESQTFSYFATVEIDMNSRKLG